MVLKPRTANHWNTFHEYRHQSFGQLDSRCQQAQYRLGRRFPAITKYSATYILGAAIENAGVESQKTLSRVLLRRHLKWYVILLWIERHMKSSLPMRQLALLRTFIIRHGHLLRCNDSNTDGKHNVGFVLPPWTSSRKSGRLQKFPRKDMLNPVACLAW